ncbi:hypothetical protein AURDEDRAFT_113892 [Auricularia subglabra TFB-10046 SS5]|nr:hypothetical protein AURDEDRAFT_113892 [Auricularia subglabra TFB-10046 SS5]
MKFASSFVSLALLASLVAAAPTTKRNENNKNASARGKGKATNNRGGNNRGNNRGNNNANSNAVGAVYFITNDEQNNFVIASDIGADGKLTSARAVSAQGRGLHANAVGPDPLFSQGSIKVLNNNLFTVNTGSNTVAMFAINPNAPSQLQMIGNPVSSQGEFPVSIAVSSTSGNICVLNGGQLNSVACFKPDAQQGLLPISNSFRQIGITQSTAPAGPAGTVSHVLFNSDGSKLVASVKGSPPNPGFLAVWDVQADGSLSENFQAITPPTGGLLPFGMSNFPANPAAMIVTDAGIGFDVIDVEEALAGAAAAANATTGITSLAQTNVVAAGRSTANAVDGQVAVCWTAFSSKTGNFYMTDIGTNTVTEVNVNSATLAPTIVKQYPLGDGIATIDDDVATIGNTDFLYVLAANQTSVEVLSLNGPGQAQTVQSFRLAAGKQQSGININPDNLQGMATFVRK